jgi:hypothetical protein
MAKRKRHSRVEIIRNLRASSMARAKSAPETDKLVCILASGSLGE